MMHNDEKVMNHYNRKLESIVQDTGEKQTKEVKKRNNHHCSQGEGIPNFVKKQKTIGRLPTDYFTLILPKSTEIQSQQDQYMNALEEPFQRGRVPVVILSLIRSAFRSVVIFAQYEAGTGVCITPTGVILTCAHCLGDYPRRGNRKSLIFSDGNAYVARAIAIDKRADLALLKIEERIIDKCVVSVIDQSEVFPYATIRTSLSLNVGEDLICIGQPGRDDLECEGIQRKTGYPLIDSSHGNYHGLLCGDIHDNFEIGKMKHSCWTYWGHSGAPLLSRSSGEIIGMHSSWDDRTGMRHGIHLHAIQEFVAKHSKVLH